MLPAISGYFQSNLQQRSTVPGSKRSTYSTSVSTQVHYLLLMSLKSFPFLNLRFFYLYFSR
jgi:hypothetical protein